MVACNQAVLDPSVPEDQQRQEEEQPFFNLNRILKVNISTRDIPVDARPRIEYFRNHVISRSGVQRLNVEHLRPWFSVWFSVAPSDEAGI